MEFQAEFQICCKGGSKKEKTTLSQEENRRKNAKIFENLLCARDRLSPQSSNTISPHHYGRKLRLIPSIPR